MRKLAKLFLMKVHLLQRGLVQNLGQVKRKVRRIDSSIIENYYAEQKIRKLHIGCGENILNDWLNSEFYPRSDSVLHLDATDMLPFENDMFNYIFSEHMIEHISYSNGLAMLSECHRVLRNNGKIRKTVLRIGAVLKGRAQISRPPAGVQWTRMARPFLFLRHCLTASPRAGFLSALQSSPESGRLKPG